MQYMGLIVCCFAKVGNIMMDEKTLKDFDYQFNEKGELKELDNKTGEITDTGFKFDFYPEKAKNQKRYEEIGEIINREVFRMLETEAGLERVEVGEGEVKSFVFCSPNVQTASKVVLLIHGSGVVRAGQWARRLIINNNLDCGTMLPYIRLILSRGWGVIVLNTNHNLDPGSGDRIPGNETPENHAVTVWSQLVRHCTADQVVVIAHSYGGVVTMALAGHPDTSDMFTDKVVGVFLTDSVHYGLSGNKPLDKKLKTIGKNYVTSDQPVGLLLDSRVTDIPLYSSGAEQHEWTSYKCQEEIFKDMERVFSEPITNGNSVKDVPIKSDL